VSVIYALKIFEGVYTYVKSMTILFNFDKCDENMIQAAIYTKIHHLFFGNKVTPLNDTPIILVFLHEKLFKHSYRRAFISNFHVFFVVNGYA
jgi:hypothetical protein